jgi:hypothetical protein
LKKKSITLLDKKSLHSIDCFSVVPVTSKNKDDEPDATNADKTTRIYGSSVGHHIPTKIPKVSAHQLVEPMTDSFSARTTAVKAGNLAAALSGVVTFPALVATSEAKAPTADTSKLLIKKVNTGLRSNTQKNGGEIDRVEARSLHYQDNGGLASAGYGGLFPLENGHGRGVASSSAISIARVNASETGVSGNINVSTGTANVGITTCAATATEGRGCLQAGAVGILVGMGSSGKGKGGNIAMTAGDTLGVDAASGGWIHTKSRFSAETSSGHISISTASAGLDESVSGSTRPDAGTSSEGASDAKGGIRLKTGVTAKGDSGDIRFHTGEGTQDRGGDIGVLVGVGDTGIDRPPSASAATTTATPSAKTRSLRIQTGSYLPTQAPTGSDSRLQSTFATASTRPAAPTSPTANSATGMRVPSIEATMQRGTPFPFGILGYLLMSTAATPAPTASPHWAELKSQCESSACDTVNGGCIIVLSGGFVMDVGAYSSEISFSSKNITLWGQGKVLDASGGGRIFEGEGAGSFLELHDVVLQNGEANGVSG